MLIAGIYSTLRRTDSFADILDVKGLPRIISDSRGDRSQTAHKKTAYIVYVRY